MCLMSNFIDKPVYPDNIAVSKQIVPKMGKAQNLAQMSFELREFKFIGKHEKIVSREFSVFV